MVDFTGPIGGILAAAYGAGAVSGWTFAHKIVGKQIRMLRDDMAEDKADCDKRIADLTNRLRVVEDRGYQGLERQLGQVHNSALHIIRNGRIDPPLEDER